MKLNDLRDELYSIASANLSFEEKFFYIDRWFSKHVFQLGVKSVITLDSFGRHKHDEKYLEYHKSAIIHKLADSLLSNSLVTETKLIPDPYIDHWGIYEQRTESKLWVLK